MRRDESTARLDFGPDGQDRNQSQPPCRDQPRPLLAGATELRSLVLIVDLSSVGEKLGLNARIGEAVAGSGKCSSRASPVFPDSGLLWFGPF